jgi:hypothetical protein
MLCRHHSFTYFFFIYVMMLCEMCHVMMQKEKRMLFFYRYSSSTAKNVMLLHSNRNSPKKNKYHWFGTLLWFFVVFIFVWRRIKCHWTRTQQLKAIITIISVAHITNEAYCLAKHSHSFAKFHFLAHICMKTLF